MELLSNSLPDNLSVVYDGAVRFSLNWLKTHNFQYPVDETSVLIYGSLGQTISCSEFQSFKDSSDIDLQVFCMTHSNIPKNSGSTQKCIFAHKHGLVFSINNIPRHVDIMITCKQHPFNPLEWIEFKASCVKNLWKINRVGKKKANKFYSMLRRGFLYIHNDKYYFPLDSTSLPQLDFRISQLVL
jgi:hypothetical protein